MRYKRPDKKNSLSLVEASKKEINFALSLEVNEQSGPTIIRNIYESFRMLGDALLINQGIESKDHVECINALLKLKVNTTRPINLINNLRILRHNINYYGYRPRLEEVQEAISIAKTCFIQIFNEVCKIIKTK
ncbi:hypothetical protein HYV88_03090 [Candidatus Woesearchaeota archaeon]|nr:hypothetical protein [Candidatus Woesearchaeota archaeon]